MAQARTQYNFPGHSPTPDEIARTLAKLKLAGSEVYQRTVKSLQDPRGVHIESVLSCLGAFAGYACQFGIRKLAARPGSNTSGNGMRIVQGKDGMNYYFGDALNAPLLESPFAIWSLVAGCVQNLGKPLPDVNDIFKHVAGTVGGPQFGIPRIPEEHRPGDLPLNYLKAGWQRILPVAWEFCEQAMHLPIVFGFAIQDAIGAGKDVLDPTLAATIAMESAVPMSKVDLAR